MSVILTDAKGNSVGVNAWNWGVLHHAVACAKPPVLDDADLLEQLRFGSVHLSKEQADSLFVYLVQVVLPRLNPGQRMLVDFSVTDEPDDGTFYRGEADAARNYSLHYEVLITVLHFLKDAEPPVFVA